MAAVRILNFTHLHFLSHSPCQHAILLSRTKFRWNRTFGWWVMAKKAIFKMAAAAILNVKNCNFRSRDCNRVQYLMLCTKFHQNRTIFFTEIWRFNDFQNGGRPPSWILHICIFCPIALSACHSAFSYKISLKSDIRLMSYGQKSDFQDGGRRHLEYRVQYLMQCTKFHQNRTIFHWDGDLTIFKIAAVRHLTF